MTALGRSPVPGPWERFAVADLAADDPVLIPGAIDTVFHLAGKAHALAEVAAENESYERINTEGTRRMLEASRRAGVRAFVFFSSVKAVGDSLSSDAAMTETFEKPPTSPYGRSKRAAESLVLADRSVRHTSVLRPALVYGPSPKGNLEKMIRAVQRGRFPPLAEFGNKRSMVHIDDLIEAALLSSTDERAVGEVFIVADNHPFSTRQLLEWISAAAGRTLPSWSLPLWALRPLGFAGDVAGRLRGRRAPFDSDALEKLTGNAWYSSAKLQGRLGWKPQHSLEKAIPEIVRTPCPPPS